MEKWAVVTAINNYPAPNGLRGCIDDAIDVETLLKLVYGFEPTKILVLKDKDVTKANHTDILMSAVAQVKDGDVFVHWNSGHGTRIRVKGKMKACTCPIDFDFTVAKAMTSDDYYKIFSKLPAGVSADWVSDSCLSGSTRIPLLDGTEKTIAEMHQGGGTYWVYSALPDGQIVAGKAHSARKMGIKPIYRLTLDNGEYLDCTSDHRIMLRSGEYAQTGDLRPGDSLMPLYRRLGLDNDKYLKGYELSWTTVKTRIGRRYGKKRIWKPTHLIVRDTLNMYDKSSGKTVCHHRNFNKRDNRPENLEMVKWAEHKTLHGLVGAANLRKAFSLGGKLQISRASEQYKKEQSLRVKAAWARKDYREAHLKGVRRRMETQGLPEKFKAYNFSEQNRSNTKRRLSVGGDLYEYARLESTIQFRREHMQKIWKSGHEAKLRVEQHNHAVRSLGWFPMALNNHKVVSVAVTGRVEPVYDLTVEQYHNFATSAGIFVHNCHSGDLERDFYGKGVPRLWRGEGEAAPEDDEDESSKGFAPVVRALPNIVLTSGCSPHQTSADALINGRYNGALTYFLVKCLLQPDGSLLSRKDTRFRLLDYLAEGGYSQIPNLVGPEFMRGRPYFTR
jgi:hypothetical protein